MYSSSSHSQFYPTATGHWSVRPRRWATGLTTAALLLLMPHHGRAHDEGPPQPPLPVTLQITGLQHAYPIGQPISGQVVVTTIEQLLASSLEIVVVDPDTCVSPTNCPELFRKSYQIKLKAAGSETISFGLPQGAVSAYTLTATLTGKTKSDNVGQKRTLATATTRFGIRQAELTGVLDYILKAEVVSLDVPGILAQLTAGATTGTPVTLSFGTRQITVQVVREEFLAPGVELPDGLGRPLTFAGPLINVGGNVDRSLAAFTAPNNQLSAMVQEPRTGLQSIDTLWVSPLEYMQTGAGTDRYVIYLQSHTLPHPKNGPEHGQPAFPTPPASVTVRQAALQTQTATSALALNSFPVKYPVSAQVYEHEASFDPANQSSYRWTLIVNWASHLKAKFSGGGILPRTVADCQGQNTPECQDVLPIAVVVPEIHIDSWRRISSAGYGEVCLDNLNTFVVDTEAGLNGVPFDRHLQVLFTEAGKDCGGQGAYGSNTAAGVGKRMYSITRDQSGLQGPDTMVLLQEIGHNLDWHNPFWCGSISSICTQLTHNSHVSPEISETELIALGPLFRCTAMHGSYGGCTEAQPTYSWGSGRPLQHLAEGIVNMFFSTE